MFLDFLVLHKQAIIEFGIILSIVLVLFKLLDIFNKNLKDKIIAKHGDKTILGFLPIIEKLIRIVIVFFAIATFLQSHGYSVTSLIAGFGITGLAVGFGAQATIANVFGSFSLLADKAYRVGDYIIINQNVHDKVVEGVVEDINLRSTKIRCLDGLIIVPNNLVATGVVKNISLKENCHEN